MTVARAVNFAEVEVPELYLMRRIMDRGSDVARAVVQQNDKLIKADDFITFMRKHYC